MNVLQAANLGLRFLLELCLLASLSYWGFHGDKSMLLKIVLGLGTPLIAAIIWGLFLSPKASVPITQPFPFILELVVFATAIIALYSAGKPSLAIAFTLVYIVNRTLIYFWQQ
ncbi:YrdB family protein [Paenibacillus aceris]|nr:YrdB family protein [Paenibacillus aceris]